MREHGKVFRLPEVVGGDDALAAAAAVQKLRSRILADDLRALVGDFVALCTEADTTAILIHKDDPPEELDALLNDLVAQLGARYVDLVEMSRQRRPRRNISTTPPSPTAGLSTNWNTTGSPTRRRSMA